MTLEESAAVVDRLEQEVARMRRFVDKDGVYQDMAECGDHEKASIIARSLITVYGPKNIEIVSIESGRFVSWTF